MNDTLCWDCRNTSADICTWFDPIRPRLPSRATTATIYRRQDRRDTPFTIITACPNFRKEM